MYFLAQYSYNASAASISGQRRRQRQRQSSTAEWMECKSPRTQPPWSNRPRWSWCMMSCPSSWRLVWALVVQRKGADQLASPAHVSKHWLSYTLGFASIQVVHRGLTTAKFSAIEFGATQISATQIGVMQRTLPFQSGVGLGQSSGGSIKAFRAPVRCVSTPFDCVPG